MVTRIDIYHTREEPDQPVIRMTPEVSRTTIICEVATKSKSGPYSRDEVLAPSDARPGRHPVLPHSPSNTQP
jgi:hypothetical protein